MEDKELQELFDAKRTTEANRHRQEELRRLIEAQEAPRTRKLWPVWTGAAAAAIALLLLTLPSLYDNQESTPTLIARTEVPTPTEEPSNTIETIDTIGPIRHISPISPKNSTSSTSPQIPDTTSMPEPEETPIIEERSAPAEVEQQMLAPSPRVMRRQSTQLACTEGCQAPEGTSKGSSRNVQVHFFKNDQYAEATIQSFVIN